MRQCLSVISAGTNRGTIHRKNFEYALNTNILIDFVKQLSRDYGRKTQLILDNLRVHRSKPLREWMAQHEREIEVLYLPSHSPKPDPDAMLNAEPKPSATKLASVGTKLQLVKAAA
jgi:hypothetical protein